MRFKYGKYTPVPLDDLDMDELMSKLSDLLLSSGFNDPYFSGSEDERSMQALYDAILEALLSGGVLPEETLKQLLGDQADAEAQQRLEQLIQQIMERMQENGYITSGAGYRRRARSGASGPGGMGEGERAADALRGHRQGDRLSGLPRAARSARLARQEQLRPPRHARSRDRHRGLGRHEGVRVRRHAEPRRERDGAERRAAPARVTARGRHAGPGVRGPRRRAGRVSELVRDGDHARLQPQHDPLRRGSLHAGQAGRAGALAADSTAVSRRQPEPGAVPRLGRGSAASASSGA